MPSSPAALPVPTPAQIAWADSEIGVIIHLDVQVFEPGYAFRTQWGYTPDPSVFTPAGLDTDQWIATAKAAGAKYAVLVAKHCSGFSLWPTEAHDYSVKSTPWRDGKGDVVGDFFKSCAKYGLRPGLYYSTSCNARLQVDNPGTPRSGDAAEQARYNRIVETQLTELWSNYGEIFYIWFDGGVLPPEQGGPTIIPLLKKLQPNAVVYQGPEDWPSLTRFVGNERAEAPDPFWNTTDDLTHDDGTIEKDGLGGNPDGTRWVCGESDMPNRCQKRAFQGGWFWRKDEERFLYSLDHMVECYYTSIGRNTNLLIGMVIDDRGLIPEADRARFLEFGARMGRVFSNRLASTCGSGTSHTLSLPPGSSTNMLSLMEEISEGERVHAYRVEGLVDGKWIVLWKGTSIGHKKVERIAPVAATELRLTVTKSAGEPRIREWSAWSVEDGLFSVPMALLKRPRLSFRRGADGNVGIHCSNPALGIRYTLDGTEPHSRSPVYEKPFPLPDGGVVKAHAFLGDSDEHDAQRTSPTAQAAFGVDRRSWRVVGVSLDSPFANGGQAGVHHLLDDDPKTYWHTFHTDKAKSAPPHEVILDMGREREIEAFTFLPREGGSTEGIPDRYRFELSPDGASWTPAAEGNFADAGEIAGMLRIPLKHSMPGRYLRFIAQHALEDINYVVVAGIGAIEAKPPSALP